MAVSRLAAAVVTTGIAFNVMFTGTSQEAMAEQAKVIDNARVLSPSSLQSLTKELQDLETQTRWRVRVLTTFKPLESSKQLKQLWETDDRTIVVVEDVTSPNVLTFSTGSTVSQQLPRQFFLELQSRFGNQFYVKQEGEGQALVSTLGALQECLSKAGGCRNVPGLTDDLYYLTLATSIAGGCVFGFGARVSAAKAAWKWILIFSPLWLLLFGSFGVLPIISRTSELEPLVKNFLGFLVGAAAIYLTPILGPPPGQL